MIMHALLNLISSSIMLFLPTMGIGGFGRIIAGMLFLLIVVLFLMGLVQLIRHLRKKDLRLDNSMLTAIPGGEVVKTVYLNPCVMLFLLYSTATIVLGLMNIQLFT